MTTRHHERWTHVLDELEADLAAFEAALDSGELPPLGGWQPPGELGAPPPELAERARAVAHRLITLQQRAGRRLAELGEEISGLDHRRRAGAAYAGDRVG